MRLLAGMGGRIIVAIGFVWWSRVDRFSSVVAGVFFFILLHTKTGYFQIFSDIEREKGWGGGAIESVAKLCDYWFNALLIN